MRPQKVIYQDLGLMPYKEAWDYQEKLLNKNVRIKSSIRELAFQQDVFHDMAIKHQLQTENFFLFVEHPPVYTLGKSGSEENILIDENERVLRGIEYFKTNRGGDITFHGPGQVVGYPIIDLEKFYTDIGKYLRNIEEVIILTLSEYNIKGRRSFGETGVWIDPEVPGMERKICAIGVRCSRWITMHGFAFNVNTDLGYFDHIIPCGIRNKKVTSLKKELGYDIPVVEVKEKIMRNFQMVFKVEMVENSND